MEIELNSTFPILNKNWPPEKDQFDLLLSLANSLIPVYEPYADIYVNLKKEYFKHRIGRIGNLVAAVGSFVGDYEMRDQSYIVELLFIE